MEPLAGAAPARFSYKENLQAAAKRQRKWWPARVTRPVLRIKSPLHHFNACRPEKWSQPRVLSSAELAYETGSSAGPIAYGAPTWSCTRLKLAYRASASLTMLWGL